MSKEEELRQKQFHVITDTIASVINELRVDHPAAKELVLESIEFRTTLSNESDRGAALMSAAFLDEKLKRVLLATFVDDGRSARSALEFNGPLGTFSSRIELAYLVGLVPANVRADLHLIRKIRNEFAHIAGPLDFNAEKIAPRCNQLRLHDSEGAPNASKFRRTVMRLLSVIDVLIVRAIHAPMPADIDEQLVRKDIRSFQQAWESNPELGAFPLTDHFPYLKEEPASQLAPAEKPKSSSP